MSDKRCDKCDHYEPNNPQEGGCRRSPPVRSPDDGFIWPIMEAGEWCGEFKPTDEPWPDAFRILGVVCGSEPRRVTVHCDTWQPREGARVEMRIVGPEE